MTSELVPADMQTTGSIERVTDPAPPNHVVPPAPPPAVVEVISPAATEVLTCPECGTTAAVTVNRRDAADFCRKCDYPLFWTPSRVHYDSVSRSADETLRRLPGTVGRATVASLPCPHCAEPNALTAEICVRCGLSMLPTVAPPPPPEPVYAPPPQPEVYVEPERGIPWWVWALLATGVAALATVVILLLTHTI
ncbi:MAG: hypothetical protein JWR06_189 [Jatrophihabitans sp.]|jgi:hypothetical protein|nr:hypothetical protein [Jatrophihabitans sp.]MCW2655996.1 hypothetical protein [Jatrophihabitans sp.]MDT4902635.1 hypothetical protein [Pseudonocardiales bacterium]MDT4929508.1 hypothetical protein [Pseudonocardiales bacterium]MDT4951088.1 hypothetical protein [Pseudonocardiales bacterium]